MKEEMELTKEQKEKLGSLSSQDDAFAALDRTLALLHSWMEDKVTLNSDQKDLLILFLALQGQARAYSEHEEMVEANIKQVNQTLLELAKTITPEIMLNNSVTAQVFEVKDTH